MVPAQARQYWLRKRSPNLTAATSGITNTAMSSSAPEIPPSFVCRSMPHLRASFSAFGYHDGSRDLAAISRSNLVGLPSASGLTTGSATGTSAASVFPAIAAASLALTFSTAGWTTWKIGSSVPAVSMPVTMPMNMRSQYRRAYFQTRP